MRSGLLVLGCVVSALLGVTVAKVEVLNEKDKVNFDQQYRSLCTVTDESFRGWKLPNGKLVTTTDTNKRLHVESIGTQHYLVFKNVRVDDGGNYECLGSQNSAPFLLQIPFNILPDADQEVHIDRSATIHLNAHGYPQPDISWKKDGVPLRYSSRVILKDDGSIEFKTVKAEDNGTYSYTVTQFQGTNVKAGDIRVIVYDEAKITRKPYPTSRRVTAGLNTTFVCEATGFPKPKITWWDETSQKELDPFFQKHYSFSADMTTWTIIGIVADDKRKYSCRATNDAGNAKVIFEIAYVDVPAEIAGTVVDVVTEVGQKATLTCKTDEGTPQPTVRWLQNNQQYIAQKFNDDKSESVITFDNVKLTDAGQFVCEARNRAVDEKGNQIVVKKTVSLNVRSKPVLNEKASPKVVYSYVGNSKRVTVQCVFLGYPPPKVELIAPNKTVLATGNHTASIKVTTRSPSDFSNFTCKAENEEGTETVDLQLRQAGDPSVPRDVFYEKTCKTITLKWTAPADNGGMPLTDYVISAGQHSENVPPTDDNMEHELQEEFEPEATYVVDILASTEAGQSSKVTKTITTNKYCVPGKPSIISRVQQVETNELNLKWTAPDYDGGDSRITYKVEWKPIGSGEPKVKTGIKELEVTLTDLSFNTEYEVKLYAVNQQGTSDPATMYFKVGDGSGANPGGSKLTTKSTISTTEQPTLPSSPLSNLTNTPMGVSSTRSAKPTGSSTGHTEVPGHGGDAQASSSGLSNGAIAGIVIAVILIVLIAIDLFCCFFNSCGLFFCCSQTICGGGGGKGDKYKDNSAKEMEKQRLPENV